MDRALHLDPADVQPDICGTALWAHSDDQGNMRLITGTTIKAFPHPEQKNAPTTLWRSNLHLGIKLYPKSYTTSQYSVARHMASQ